MADRGGATRKFKVVLLGEGRVGKTSILLRYIKGEYDDRQVSTLQASYLDKRLMVDNAKVQLSLWDTAGQERFHALGPIYYRDADGALLVYDITDDESFKKVRTWVKELRRIVGDDIDISIAGNKSDLQRNRKVSEEEAKKYAESVGATHFTTSAKLNRGLEDVFVELTKRMLTRTAAKKKKSALIADDEPFMAPPPPSRGPGASAGGRATTGSMAPPRVGGAARGGAAAAQHGRSSESHAHGHGRGGAAGGGAAPASHKADAHQQRPGGGGGGAEGGGGSGRQLVIEDDVDDPFSSPSRMADSNGLRVRGASNHQAQHEAAKAKSGCC